jgi:hypothetical protein
VGDGGARSYVDQEIFADELGIMMGVIGHGAAVLAADDGRRLWEAHRAEDREFFSLVRDMALGGVSRAVAQIRVEHGLTDEVFVDPVNPS